VEQKIPLTGFGRHVDYPQLPVAALFADQAKSTPEAPALVDRDAVWSYGDLRVVVNRIAHRLRRQGVGRDDVVGVLADGSAWLVAGMLGVLSAGGAYMPLDPTYPAARVAAMLSALRPKLVLATRDHFDRASATGCQVLLLDGNGTGPADDLVPVNEPGDLAYVIFTSGSTGRPKGILQTHRCLSNFLQWQVRDSGFERSLRVLQCAAVGFDVSVQEILATILSGGSLHVTSGALRRDLPALARLIIERGIEVLDFPPSVIRVLLTTSPSLADAPALRHLISAGEPLLVTTELRRLLERRPDLRLHNHYGPAETHMLTSHTMSSELRNVEQTPPLGRVISNMRAYVLDAEKLPTAEAEVGEIYIAGPGLARGYIDPTMTRERFLPHPFEPGSRIYRTSDRGRWRADGALELVGRQDDMVKIRGYRVEPAEIEASLARHPAVRNAAVVSRERFAGEKELVACIVSREPLTSTQVRAHLADDLPEYMIPARFVSLAELPLSPNGKIDRNSLSDLEAPELPASATMAHPATPIEASLVQVWRTILSIDRLGTEDDLFALGCDSLKAVRGLIAMGETAGVNLTLRDVYETRTVKAMAARSDHAVRKPHRHEIATPFVPAAGLSPGQRALWHTEVGHGRPGVTFTQACRLPVDVRETAIHEALAAVVARHDALRLAVTGDGWPRAAYAHAVDLPCEHLGLLGRGGALDDVEAVVSAASAKPFDLQRPPLMRAALATSANGDRLLLLTLHHIVADAWSMAILRRDLAAALRGVMLPPIDWGYRNYVEALETWLASPACEPARTHWRSVLAKPPQPLRLPTDGVPATDRSGVASFFSFTVEAETTRLLAARSQAMRASLFMGAFAAFLMVLYRWTGQEDMVVGTTMAGRSWPRLAAQVGLFANLAPIRALVRGEDPWIELVERVRAAILAAHQHEMMPFPTIVDELGLESERGRSPGFDVGFQLLPEDLGAGDSLPVVTCRWSQTARNHLWFAGMARCDRIDFLVEYDSGLFRQETIARLSRHFAVTLRALAEQPERSAGSLPLDECRQSAPATATKPFAFSFEYKL
jgi:amino acid adenylation domain-containing protein